MGKKIKYIDDIDLYVKYLEPRNKTCGSMTIDRYIEEELGLEFATLRKSLLFKLSEIQRTKASKGLVKGILFMIKYNKFDPYEGKYSGWPTQIFNEDLVQLINNFEKIEPIIYRTKTIMGNKFYRDHLGHMIRSYLLSLKFIKDLNLEKNKGRALRLATLLHDIMIPIQEFGGILDNLNKAFEPFYIVKTKGASLEKSIALNVKKFWENIILNGVLIDLKLEVRNKLSKYVRSGLKNFNKFVFDNHGLLGAYLIYNKLLTEKIKKEKWAREAITAIALHDIIPKVDELDHNFSKHPVVALLVIIDELQEFNRQFLCTNIYGVHTYSSRKKPNGGPYIREKFVTPSNKLGIKIKNSKICAQIDYSKPFEGFKPLLQVIAKTKSLMRFNMEDYQIEIYIKLPTDYPYVNQWWRGAKIKRILSQKIGLKKAVRSYTAFSGRQEGMFFSIDKDSSEWDFDSKLWGIVIKNPGGLFIVRDNEFDKILPVKEYAYGKNWGPFLKEARRLGRYRGRPH